MRAAAWITLGLLGLTTAPAAARVEGPVFPPPPAEPRLVFEESLRDDDGYRGPRSLLGRIADVLTGSGESAAMVRPHGLACDGPLLLIADPDAGVVHLFDRDKHTYRRLPRDGRLASPVDAAVDADGRIWVADSAAGALVVFDREGREQARYTDGIERPAGLAWDRASGRLYVADPVAHRVAVLDAQGRLLDAFGARGETDGAFNFPVDVCLDPQGGVWVLDALNFRVCALAPDGAFLSSFGAQGDAPGAFARPRGLACDADGHLWISDALQDGVQVFDAQGRLLMAFGTQGRADGEFWMPAGVAFDDRANLYVADAYNRRVQVFRYLGDAEGGRP